MVVEGKYDPSFIFTHEGTVFKTELTALAPVPYFLLHLYKSLAISTNSLLLQTTSKTSHRVTTHSSTTKSPEG